MPRFPEVRERILRADHHLKESTERWARLLEDEPHSASVEIEPDGAGTIYVTPRYDPLPVVFAIELGEVLYHLRAALDSLVYHAAIYDSGKDPPPNHKNLEFPFTGSIEDFEKLAYKIAPLSQERRAIIEGVQPYQASHLTGADRLVVDGLATLHDWARIDRHRRLHVVGSWASRAQPRFRLPAGVTLTNLALSRNGHFLEEENKVAGFVLHGWKPGMKIQANPDLFIDITVREISPFGPNPTLELVTSRCIKAVENALYRFEASY